MARPRFKPTAENRNAVERLAAMRIPEDEIASIIGIDPKTLRKYFSVELKRGAAKGHVNLKQKAYQMAMDGDGPMLRYLLDKFDAKQSRGYHENDSEGPSVSEVHGKLAELLARRAAAAQFQKLRAEQLGLSAAEAQAAADVNPGIFYGTHRPTRPQGPEAVAELTCNSLPTE
jgi:hypothetical protein